MIDKKFPLAAHGIIHFLALVLVIASVSTAVADGGFERKKESRHGDHRPRFSSGDIFQDPFTGTTFVYAASGCFHMGCDNSTGQKCSRDETPRHKICLDGFWISRYEVTQALWQQVTGRNPSRQTGSPDLPVETVSFKEIQAFLKKLNRSSGRFYSLPTEAQWEYACRLRPKGMQAVVRLDASDRILDANCATCGSGGQPGMGPRRTMPVGSHAPNFLGLYDMLGNVKEWCADFYDKRAYQQHQQKNPVILEKSASRVIRGGSFLNNASKVTCRSRDKSIPALKSSSTGFRLIMAAPGLHN